MTTTSSKSIGSQCAAVVERDADFGDAQRRALVAAGEDHVFGLAGAQRAAGVLAQHPAQRVGDVRLAGAVRADDARHAGRELQLRLVGEALEALDVESLKIHSRFSSLDFSMSIQRLLRRFLLGHLLAAALADAQALRRRPSPAP